VGPTASLMDLNTFFWRYMYSAHREISGMKVIGTIKYTKNIYK